MSESNSATDVEAVAVDTCASCETALPLVSAPDGEASAQWVCAKCGTEMAGLFDPAADEKVLGNVKLALMNFDRASLAAPSRELQNYVAQQKSDDGQFEERRDATRRTVSQSIAVQALDEQYRPQGDPFLAISRDVSRQGIALIHSEPINSGFLALELTSTEGNRLQIVMHATRLREIDGFHEAAGPMVMRMGVDDN